MDTLCTRSGRRRGEQGFTLLEIMVVVAIVAILAAVVVPSWLRDSRKTKANSEVGGMFAEIGVKEEQYKIENHVYLSAASCPTAPSSAGVDFQATCVTTGSGWANLRIAPTETKLYCTYAITAGLSTATPVPPTGFTMTAPATSWWFAVATCDIDGKGGTNTTYFQSSVDPTIQRQNYGS